MLTLWARGIRESVNISDVSCVHHLGADAAREAELRATIRAHLGDREYERSQAGGERLTRAQVAAYALGPALDSARRVVADAAPQG